MKIESNFVPYQIALDMKSIGFDEPCLAFWDNKNTDAFYFNNKRDASGDYVPFQKHDKLKWFAAPLYQQAFRWFREKHNLHHVVIWDSETNNFDAGLFGELPFFEEDTIFTTYEEAESACLDKLIEIIKTKTNG